MVLLMSYPMIYLLIRKVNQNRRRELSSKNWSFKQFLTRWSHLKIRSLFNLNNIHSSGYFQNFLSNIELPNKFPSIVTWHQAAGGQQGQPMGGHSLYPDLGFPHLEGTGPCSPGLMAWPAKPPPTSRELAPALPWLPLPSRCSAVQGGGIRVQDVTVTEVTSKTWRIIWLVQLLTNLSE